MSQIPYKTDAPPPYGMSAPPPQPQVIQPVAMLVVPPALGPEPCNIQCPSCHASVQTRVTHESTTKTHLIAVGLCLIGCWPFVCIPYCMDSCQNTNHNCPACGAYLGSYEH